MTDKQLSTKQINILVKNGVKEPWNMPYQEAADKIGEILSKYNDGEKPLAVEKPAVPLNGKEYHLSIEECRARALECAIKRNVVEKELEAFAKRYFNWIWRGE